MDGYNHNAAFGDYYPYGVPAVPSFDSTPARREGYPSSFNGFEIQPLETCPKNFIIFDQNEDKGRIMFHPALAQQFSYQDFNFSATHVQDYGKNPCVCNANYDKASSLVEDDSDEIDALLSLEGEGEEDEEDDDCVSTGRTPANHGNTSPGSISSTGSFRSQGPTLSSQASSSNARGVRKERMRTMVKTLRGIIPGGDQMDTPAIFDEAVRYLKSLKMEVKKFKNGK